MTGPVVGGPHGPYRQVREYMSVATQPPLINLYLFSLRERLCTNPMPTTSSLTATPTDAFVLGNGWI